MVTIEQKLSLFSKLLQQDVKNDAIEKIEQLEQEYEKKLKENKRVVDKQAEDFVENTLKKAQAKKLEIISKAKMETKKYSMAAKEKNIKDFMNKLDQKCDEFIESEAYKTYLDKQIARCVELKDLQDHYIVAMTQKDSDKYGEYIIEELVKIGLKKEQLAIETRDGSMIGGFILEVPSKNIRVDLSIKELIQGHKNSIVEKIFAAIEEDGETT